MNTEHKPPLSELKESDLVEGIAQNENAIEHLKKKLSTSPTADADRRKIAQMKQENEQFQAELTRRGKKGHS